MSIHSKQLKMNRKNCLVRNSETCESKKWLHFPWFTILYLISNLTGSAGLLTCWVRFTGISSEAVVIVGSMLSSIIFWCWLKPILNRVFLLITMNSISSYPHQPAMPLSDIYITSCRRLQTHLPYVPSYQTWPQHNFWLPGTESKTDDTVAVPITEVDRQKLW